MDEDNDIKITDILLVALYIVAHCAQRVKILFFELFLLTSIVPIWILGNELHQKFKELQNLKWDNRKTILPTVNTMLRRVGRLTRLYNETYGLPLVGHLICYFLYFSTDLDVLFRSSSPVGKIYRIQFTTMVVVMNTCAAMFGYKLIFKY